MIAKIKRLLSYRNSQSLIKYLRKQGIKIGDGCIFRRTFGVVIDIQRPSLISIGNNVDMNKNFSIYTHDYSSGVFKNVYGTVLNSSGAVSIGNNIYFGANCTILKGVTIGDNCIIGAGSIVSHSIPANSVAVGNPCNVICTLDEYFHKREIKAFDEAIEYIKSINERYGRRPYLSEMREEFIYFVDKRNINDYLPKMPIINELGHCYIQWLEKHKARFASFDEFIDFALNYEEQ